MLPKTYKYKMYRSGVFLGLLPNVTSPFEFSQDINTAGAQLRIIVGQSIDVSHESVASLETEEGLPITTEALETITTERTPDIAGNDNGAALIRNNNEVRVYEYSTANPNGVLVFTGYISRWHTVIGTNDSIDITVLSKGADLDNYLIETGESVTVLQDSGTDIIGVSHTFAGIYSSDLPLTVGQSFQVAASTSVKTVSIHIRRIGLTGIDNNVKVTLVNLGSSPYNAAYPFGSGDMTSVTRDLSSISTSVAGYQDFTFPTAQTLVAGTYYGIRVQTIYEAPDLTSAPFELTLSVVDVYANGHMSQYGGYGSPHTINFTSYDLRFKVWSTTGGTVSAYTAQDPTTILRAILDDYAQQGGGVSYTTSTTDLTSNSVDYTFKVNTILEGVKKCLDLSPSTWYWYVDPATQVLYFKQTATTADHIMVLGQHFSSIDLQASVEKITTKVYFSGGPTAGTNLFVSTNSATNLAANAGRQTIKRVSDNRVTAAATGTLIANNVLADNATEQFLITIVIPASVYDINLFTLGQVVAFAGFANFVDDLLLQITRKHRLPDAIELTLGALPTRFQGTLEQISRDLDKLQTIDNPSVPS